ncbi:threonine/serine ThrE exporter family protein [Agromyces protaetiae]|uniref:threonine/serine ThrE exporter family protein n=1 Tax=Agromyces protaetiae TaxID=2509455 RepID=UPI0013EB29A4|nr:threonine/serine exporter family protein [Agromyces protaetiae]
MSASVRPTDDAMLRRFLLGLAEGLNAAMEPVDRIRDIMLEVARAYGRSDVDFVVLPTVILVETGSGDTGKVALRSTLDPSFRFDQIQALYDLVAKARTGSIAPVDGIARLNAIGSMRPRYRWPVRVLGHAILTTGLALLLAPTWQGALVSFVLGAFLGLGKLIRSPTIQLVFPVVAAFLCALAVFLVAPYIAIGDPIRLMIAPLATFLPGGVLTTATRELAAGQMIAGASRLVTGLVQLALLAFGILAAGTLVGVGSSTYLPLEADGQLPWWVGAVGVLLFAAGNLLHFSAPGRTFGWLLLALAVAYVGQTVGQALAGSTISGFIGALAMTPVVLWIGSLKHGVPAQLAFLPAFWLLVPGAAGLVGLTEAIGSDRGMEDFVAALVSVMSIALGVLFGSALYRVVHHGAEELADFHIDMPAAIDEVVKPRFWARLLPWRHDSVWRRIRRGEASTPSSESPNT